MVAQRVLGEVGTLRSPSGSGAATPPRDCLTEDEVLSLCEGRATSGDLPSIDEHLDDCNTCQQWVAETLRFTDRSSARVDDTLHPTMMRPGMLAAERFRIIRFIKRGGMGEVYEAFDQVLEAPVALKTIISTACDNPRAIRKLKEEVQLARSIRHPNVCSVFDFWEHRAGDERGSVYFFTMELIEGETLGQRLKSGPLRQAEASRLARLQLCGLRAAHVSGVVHRDFKSDNVMLRSQPQGSDVVVMDFGLARLVPVAGGSHCNDSEQFAGSVAYMAPEQVEGRRNIGTEADVFSFGVVFFEMLTGQLPFSGDSPWTIATRRLTDRPPAPSRLNPRVSPALDAFVLKCMSREPSQRFKDASAALAALEALAAPPRSATRIPGRWLASAVLLVAGGVALKSLFAYAPWSKARAAAESQPPVALVTAELPATPSPANDRRSPPVLRKLGSDPLPTPEAASAPIAPPRLVHAKPCGSCSSPNTERSQPGRGNAAAERAHREGAARGPRGASLCAACR